MIATERRKMYENEILVDEDSTIDYGKTMQNVVLAALTSEQALLEASRELLEKYEIQHDPKPSLVDIAREAQTLSISISGGLISDELRDNRIKALLKKVVLVVPEEHPETPVDSLGE